MSYLWAGLLVLAGCTTYPVCEVRETWLGDGTRLVSSDTLPKTNSLFAPGYVNVKKNPMLADHPTSLEVYKVLEQKACS